MSAEERLVAKALCFSVAVAWLGVYLDDFLFCVLSGVFLGIALTLWSAIRAFGPQP